jgi:phage shock protein C
MNKKLYRDEYHKVLGGVCSGLAEYFEMDVTVVRLLFAFTFFIMGVGFIPYIILWIVLPKKGYTFNNYNNPTVDYTVPPQQPGGEANTTPPQQPGNNPYTNTPYTNTPFTNSPFTNTPFTNSPFSHPTGNVHVKHKSNAGIIVGVVLIIIGAAVLIDNYDLIPNFDFDRLWPVVLVVIGGAFIISGQKKQPWEKQEWQAADKKEAPAADDTATTENTDTNSHTPTVE